MPIHLLWGDDTAARERFIENLIKQVISPEWSSINFSRLDGSDAGQAMQALDEARTLPFGHGDRVVLLKNSPFCNSCSLDLCTRFEAVLELIPNNSHLILTSKNKPDNRLKSTKALKKLINSKKSIEKHFALPPVWDQNGQKELIEHTANEMGLALEQKAVFTLIETIGNDSAKLSSELNKIALLAQANNNNKKLSGESKLLITAETINALVGGISTNSFQVSDSLLKGNIGEVIYRLDALIESGEPALRILAALISQVRGLLWVALLEKEGEKDVAVVAKAAGIANPKRIYIMRKQIQGKDPDLFLNLLGQLLKVETSLKQGMTPKNAFRDGLCIKG